MLQSAINYIVKHITPVLGIMCFILTITVVIQHKYIHTLNKEITTLEVTSELKQAIYLEEKDKAHNTIEKLNRNIELYRADIQAIQKRIVSREQILEAINNNKEEAIRRELSIDSSKENQLKIIDRMLHEFAN